MSHTHTRTHPALELHPYIFPGAVMVRLMTQWPNGISVYDKLCNLVKFCFTQHGGCHVKKPLENGVQLFLLISPAQVISFSMEIFNLQLSNLINI